MSFDFPKTGINKYVAENIVQRKEFQGLKVLDCPAGDGRSSYLLKKHGANVTSADLFPEFFEPKDIECQEVDIIKGLPFPDHQFDLAICQEGIEHFPDQLMVLREFNRVLKPGGELLITTPNISHLRAKLSYFFVESEYYKRCAPNEMDGVWFSHREKKDLYFGHLFLINNQKLRTLGVLSGFHIEKLHKTDIGTTSLLLLPIFFPFVALFNLIPLIFYSKKLAHIQKEMRKKIMWEQIRLNTSLKSLVCKHTLISFKKIRNEKEVEEYLKKLTRKESWN